MKTSSKPIITIWKKELLEFIRDWRTLLAAVIVPILAFPLLMFLVPGILLAQSASWDATFLAIEIQMEDEENVPFILAEELNSQKLQWIKTEFIMENSSIKNRLDNYAAEAILQISPKDEGNSTVFYCTIYYTSTDDSSRLSRQRIVFALTNWSTKITENRIDVAGLDVNATLDPVIISSASATDTANDGDRSALLLSYFLPALATLWTATMAVQPSIDLTAGERERGTLESLLCAPITRIETLAGKWLAIATFAGFGAILQGVGLTAGLLILLQEIPEFAPPSLGFISILLFVFALLLFTIMIVALMMAISMRTKSVKEAGTALNPAVLLLLAPIIIAQAVRLENLSLFWYAIPVVNVLLGMREAIIGLTTMSHVIVWSASSLIYAILALIWASKAFRREDLVGSSS